MSMAFSILFQDISNDFSNAGPALRIRPPESYRETAGKANTVY